MPFPEAPAPWKCKGTALAFFSRSSSSASLPASAYSPLELSSLSSGTFHGGLACICIIRYTDSPVGPYDELIYVPGKFTSSASSSAKKLRITRIYVSSRASVYNGRKNWNIPKQVADFSFELVDQPGSAELPYKAVTVKESRGGKVIFKAEFRTGLWTKALLPVSTRLSPMDLELVIPPLAQSQDWKEDGRVGTKEWKATNPVLRGKAGLTWGTGGLEGGKWGDGDGWVDANPWRLGMWLRELELDFPEAKHWDPENKKGK